MLLFIIFCLPCFSLSSCKKQESNKKEKVRLEFYNRKREAYAVLEKNHSKVQRISGRN